MAHATVKALPDDDALRRLPLRRLAETGLVVTLALAVVTLTAVFRDPERFPIREIRIEGDMTHLTGEGFRARLKEAARAGLFGIDVKALRRTILAEPWVADVAIRRVWPDTLVVQLAEQVPVARWNGGRAVNRYGEIFDPPDADLSAALVRLSGPDEAVVEVMTAFSEIAGMAAPHGLEAVSVSMSDQRALEVELADGRRIVLGTERVRERMRRFLVGYEAYLKPRWHQVSAVDMRYPNGFAVAPREARGGTVAGTGE